MIDKPEYSDLIQAREFENPERLDARLVLYLHDLRTHLGRPMYFTYHRGQLRHPWGDACPPHSGAHTDYSLHKWGIIHSESRKKDKLVLKNNMNGLAVDFDCNVTDAEELFSVYLQIEQINRFNGIGLYPNWNNRGFHVDLRSRHHPSYRTRWFCDKHGGYHRLTWKAFKEAWL